MAAKRAAELAAARLPLAAPDVALLGLGETPRAMSSSVG